MSLAARTHCDRCAELEEEIAFLKSELGEARAGEAGHDARKALGLRPGHMALALRLYRAKGHLVTKWQCEEAIPLKWAAEDRVSKIVDVYICQIRAALGRDAVETVWGQGYRLSAKGLALMAAAVEPNLSHQPEGGV